MTLLQGPYDSIQTKDKARLQCMIPEELYAQWFGPSGYYPLRGVQDKILARFFAYLHEYMDSRGMLTHDVGNEEILNDVLNSIKLTYENEQS